MNNEIEKSEPSPDDVLTAITSFNDPSIIINIFKELGWTYSFEIREWLTMARQNANLAVKSKALIQLRKLLREAAEASGYVANVSTTAPNAHGGHTTFSAKRISGILNPVKKIKSTEIKESQNDKTEEPRTEPNRGCDRGESQAEESVDEQPRPGTDSSEPSRDTRRAFPLGDADVGGTESPDGGQAERRVAGGADDSDAQPELPTKDNSDSAAAANDDSDSKESNPCIKTRPPTCDQDLFPGVSSAEG